jgi:glutathione S-transferase
MKKELKDVWPADIWVDESFWGTGTSERIYEWLASEYDPRSMPTLALARREGRLSLLGWEWEGTKFPPLIEQIFGRDYASHRMEQFNAERRIEDDLRGDLGEFGQGKGHA